ncbi:MAG: hypothetical protein JJ900_17870 [Rhodospirillales bacterium]|nr:hypothetical protein [Rhodospirillales bacterium]MBO6788719.1 hypothetical protein [Rhodospirillales bacterium]
MKKVYRRIFNGFSAPVVPLDCGEKCRHLNDGVPVCCDIGHAVPIMDKSEYKLLRSRSDLWSKYKPEDDHGEELVNSLHDDCVACECKGAKFCERDNRSLSCRAFPFFPYIDKSGEMLGLATYWTFEDRCWVISNMRKVTREFIEEFFDSYEHLFKKKPDEFDVFKDYSATMRRVFSRKKRAIYIIDRDKKFHAILPKGAGMHRVKKRELPAFEPFAD